MSKKAYWINTIHSIKDEKKLAGGSRGRSHPRVPDATD